MGSTTVADKTEEELRKEIGELHRQQREITERLRDPRGIRRGGLSGAGPHNFAANGGRQRGIVRPAERNEVEDQPPAKRRLSSAVVKLEEGEILEHETKIDAKKNDLAAEVEESVNGNASLVETKPSNWSRRDGNQRPSRLDFEIPPADHVPRVLPKDEDPSLVSRNKRMLGQLLGTLERFRKDDAKLSGSEAFLRRSDTLRRAEQRAREESEKLRQQEREQIAEKRKRDLTLRARLAAKAEEKKLELLFLQWSEHHRKLGNFIRTKAEPPIYYKFAKPLDQEAPLPEQQEREQIFEEWKAARREEVSQYQKEIAEEYVANVDKEIERWQNGRRGRKPNNDMANLQETMDKELETHQLEHGPKSRIIGQNSNNEDEDDVEDINVAEDDMIDDVLGNDDNGRRVDETVKTEAACNNGSPVEDKKDE